MTAVPQHATTCHNMTAVPQPPVASGRRGATSGQDSNGWRPPGHVKREL